VVAHHLPDRFHRVEVVGNHVVELAVPFLYFAPQPYAATGGALTIGFQLWVMLTGNFAWLNALTIVQAIPTFSDEVLLTRAPSSVGASVPSAAPTPTSLQAAAIALTVVVAVRSVKPVANILSRTQAMNASFDPVHLVNTYGAFGSITRRRYQLVIEGTDADDPGPDDWREYDFKGQPVATDERPPQWAPYHLRLDWQLWFAAMRPQPGPRQRWLFRLLEKLLANDEATLSLINHNPFPDDPPERIRVLRYRYEFTDPDERAETGAWWNRRLAGTYVEATTLDALRTGGIGRRRRRF
jgi:hypothetical protein